MLCGTYFIDLDPSATNLDPSGNCSLSTHLLICLENHVFSLFLQSIERHFIFLSLNQLIVSIIFHLHLCLPATLFLCVFNFLSDCASY